MALRMRFAGTVLSLFLVGCGGSTPESSTAEAVPAPEAESAQEAATEDEGASAEPAEEDAQPESAQEEQPAAAEEAAPRPLIKDTGVETRTTIVIQKIVAQHRQLVRDCYEKALKKNPGLKGDLTVKFVVDPVGKVKTAELNVERSTLTEPSLVECALTAVKSIQFPESSRGFESKVNYPFNLNP